MSSRPYEKVLQWMDAQEKRIKAMNEGLPSPSIYMITDNEGNVEAFIDGKPAAQHHTQKWSRQEYLIKCNSCHGKLEQRHPKGQDEFVFEFMRLYNPDGQWPQHMTSKFYHQWCFTHEIGKEYAENHKYFAKHQFTKHCAACGLIIHSYQKDTEYVTLRRLEVSLRQDDSSQFTEKGTTQFCSSCFSLAAGSLFFK